MKEFIQLLEKKGYSFDIVDGKIIINHNGYVCLSLIKTLPENITFENKGNVDLRSLKILPENTNFENDGGIYLDSIEKLPSNMFRNPKSEIIVRLNSDGIFYAGCFKGNFEDLKKRCLEKSFDEVMEWAEKLIINK